MITHAVGALWWLVAVGMLLFCAAADADVCPRPTLLSLVTKLLALETAHRLRPDWDPF